MAGTLALTTLTVGSALAVGDARAVAADAAPVCCEPATAACCRETDTCPETPLQGLAEAQRAFLEGRTGDAIEILQRLREIDPGAVEVHLWLGHAYRSEGSLARGAASYLTAARLAPGHPEVQLALGEVLERQGNLEAAERAYRRAIDLGARAAARHDLAMLLVARERYVEAVAVLRDWIAGVPDDAAAYTLLGHACFLNQQLDDAVEAYEEALRRAPDDLEARYGLGIVLAERPGRHPEALPHLRAATHLDDRRAKAYEAIGRIHMEGGDLEAAREALRRSLESDPDLAQAHYRLAQVLARLGDSEGSNAAMQAFQRLEQEATRARSGAGQVPRLKNGVYAAMAPGEDGGARDPERAEQLATELVSVAPEDPEAWVLMAKLQISLGRPDRAAQAITRALEADPAHWEALFVAGINAARDGRPDEAIRALRGSIERNPLFADAHAVLGNLLLGRGLVEQSIEEYRLALVLAPDRAAYYLNLASAYGRAGMAEEERAALDEYRRLVGSKRDCDG